MKTHHNPINHLLVLFAFFFVTTGLSAPTVEQDKVTYEYFVSELANSDDFLSDAFLRRYPIPAGVKLDEFRPCLAKIVRTTLPINNFNDPRFYNDLGEKTICELAERHELDIMNLYRAFVVGLKRKKITAENFFRVFPFRALDRLAERINEGQRPRPKHQEGRALLARFEEELKRAGKLTLTEASESESENDDMDVAEPDSDSGFESDDNDDSDDDGHGAQGRTREDFINLAGLLYKTRPDITSIGELSREMKTRNDATIRYLARALDKGLATRRSPGVLFADDKTPHVKVVETFANLLKAEVPLDEILQNTTRAVVNGRISQAYCLGFLELKDTRYLNRQYVAARVDKTKKMIVEFIQSLLDSRASPTKTWIDLLVQYNALHKNEQISRQVFCTHLHEIHAGKGFTPEQLNFVAQSTAPSVGSRFLQRRR